MEFRPMSPEEMQRTMQFIVAQQAQFAADFEKLSAKTDRMADAITSLTGIVGRVADQQERADRRADRIADAVTGLTGIIGRTAAQQERTDQQIRETDQRIRETNTRVDELGEYIRSVESHLNAVVEMFERHLREDHGQRPS